MSLFSQHHSGLDALLQRSRPSAWQRFWSQPSVFLARELYTRQKNLPRQPLIDPITVVYISDTHNSLPRLPDGDILIHAGDLTQSGSLQELQATVAWLQAQPHHIKIVVAGNHDLLLDPSLDDLGGIASAERQSLDWGNITYLENTETTVACRNGRRLRIYGSPYSPRHGSWAFQYPRSKDVWAKTVPEGIDVLITHGPPRAHLDLLNLGCAHLLREVWRVQPRLHVFGHIHEGAGIEWLRFDALQMAYERTIIASGGLGNLIKTVVAFARGLLRPATEAKCLLVNPAIVGGLRDEERRKPIVVTI